MTFPADIRAQDQCVIFDEDIYNGKEASAESKKSIDTFCGVRQDTSVSCLFGRF